MIVAFYIPHNDGVEAGLITEAGFDSGTRLVDLYEVDGEIRSFETKEEAQEWLEARHSEDDGDFGYNDNEDDDF